MIVTDDFACVVDGATSQTDRLWGGETGGQMAAQQICRTVTSLPADINAVAAVEQLTSAISGVYRANELYASMLNNPSERATAVVAIYSRFRREVWMVGDCQCLIVTRDAGTHEITNSMRVDEINAAARAMFLAAELERYKNSPGDLANKVKELRQHDVGRDFIAPLIRKQQCFRNSSGSEYSYWVVDGFPIPPDEIKVIQLPDEAEFLVLATDGYPKVLPTYDDSERLLQRILEIDPLLISHHKATKTAKVGNDSYDDRAYLRIEVSAKGASKACRCTGDNRTTFVERETTSGYHQVN